MQRLHKLRQEMKLKGISNLLVSSLSDIYYLTGFTGSAAYLFVTPENAIFITDGRYTEQSRIQVGPDFQVDIVKDYRQAVKELCEGLSGMHVTYACSLADYEMLMEMPGNVLIDSDRLISTLRMEKEEPELEKIRQMFVCAKISFEASLDSFQIGRSELLWASELERYMKINGAKSPSFDTIIASGARGALPHGIASEKLVEPNDSVVVDFGAKKEYCSDVTRLVMTGEDSDVTLIADIVYTALAKAKDKVKAGVKCSEIHNVARDYIIEKGYGDFFNHGLGHGLGIDVHEKPVFNPKDNTVLKENMVLTIEPGIYLPGKFGVRLEDTVVVKNDGCENLTAVFDKYVYKI
ncbi:MAG: hypothetical protein C0602_05330 [Denitrovibrio sp.]|nr:MAG: hypothetical protein C0602_05330 [Denitrovibrio sp.]